MSSVPKLPQRTMTMMILVGVALGWLGIGSVVGVALLKDYLRSWTRFPTSLDWRLIAAVIIGWPWPLWFWYSRRHSPIPETARTAFFALVFTGSLGLGWVGGLNLYDTIYPRELELADKMAIGAMIEEIIDPKWTGNSVAKNEHLDERRLEWIAASSLGSAKTASKPGTNR
jgi:hypothetical protein